MKQEVMLFSDHQGMENVLSERAIIQVKFQQVTYCLTRVGDQVHVFENKCPHFDYPLVEANINSLLELVCPWHGYKFSLQSGQESQSRCRKLKTYHTHWNSLGQLVMEI